MSNKTKTYLLVAAAFLNLCFAIYWSTTKTERPKPDSTPSIEISLLQDLSTFKSKEIVYKDSIKRLTASIDRLNKKGIPSVNQNWLKESERVKRLSTDDKMVMLQDWFESTQPLQKLVISNDTIIGFTLDHFVDVTDMVVDLEYKGLMIDSLQSLCEYYELSQEQYQKLVDNLYLQNVNCENRNKVKEDLLKAANDNIAVIKKQSKKNGTKRFFQGLAGGAVFGFIGGLILML